MQLTTDKQARKERPIHRGVLNYFGNAIAEVAYVSYVGNQQHNPGQPLHWAREKSTDHADCIARHLIEAGTKDDDGLRHTAKLAWRALALLQLEIEREQGNGCVAERPKTVEETAFPKTSGEFAGVDQETAHVVGGCDQCRVETVAAINGSGNPEVTGSYDYEYEEARRLSGINADPIEQRLIDILFKLNVPANVAEQILRGTSASPLAHDAGFLYIAGPMRGHKDDNFPAFDTARDTFASLGYVVTSPADIDRAAGDKEVRDQKVYAYRDFATLLMLAYIGKGGIAMLRGWEHSTGATAEFFLARWLGLNVLDAETAALLDPNKVNRSALESSVTHFLLGQWRK